MKALRYVAHGIFRDGSRFLRFPQSEEPGAHFLLYSDGSAAIAEEGKIASGPFPPGSGDAECIRVCFDAWDRGELPAMPENGR